MGSKSPKLDYTLRPAKEAERQMMVKALARLNPLVALPSYRYVGMGSIFFRDFRLFHRQLGIRDMVSIERESQWEKRIRFNLPLASIRLVMGRASEALPRIDLAERPTIAWLDYESHVGPEELADVEEFTARAAPSSVLVVTVNADRFDEDDDRKSWLSGLGTNRPEPREPLKKAEYSLLSYRALRRRIELALEARNAGVRDLHRRVHFQQIFHFVYADGAQMLTLGGALVAESDQQQWVDCGVESLEFTRNADEPLRISVPVLTRREAHHLLSELPPGHGDVEDAARKAGIPRKAAREFASVYRYAPNFVEADDW